MEPKTPYGFENELLRTGGFSGFWEETGGFQQSAAGGLGAGAPSAEGAPSALAGVRGRSPRDFFGISHPYNCKLFVVGSNLEGILARRRRKFLGTYRSSNGILVRRRWNILGTYRS